MLAIAQSKLYDLRMEQMVFTGDIVSSRQHGDARTTMALGELQAAAEAFGRRRGLDPRFTRFRGDGWQILLDRPSLMLDALLVLLSRLRACDLGVETRIAVGIGPVSSTGSADLSDAAGAAFTLSGRALDEMPARHLVRIAGARHPAEAALGPLVDLIARSWTAQQAEALAMALDDAALTQADIGARLGITRQAVQHRLSGAGAPFLIAASAAFAPGEDRP